MTSLTRGARRDAYSSAIGLTDACVTCIDLAPTQGGYPLGVVTEGVTYFYQASGCIKFQSSEPGGSADPDGNVSQDHCATSSGTYTANDDFTCAELKRYSLVGKINGGNCFQLGTTGSFTPSVTGTLVIYFNDDVWLDNSGFWHVCIARGGIASLQNLSDRNDECSQVPDPYLPQKNLPENRLYAAQRASGKVELRLQAALSPQIAGIGSSFVWGIRDQTGVLLSESGTLNDNGITDIAFTPTYDREVYTVRIGCDLNSSGTLDDPNEIIETPATPFTVQVVTQNDYTQSRNDLNTFATSRRYTSTLPVASNFLKAFLSGLPPAESSSSTALLAASEPRLTHIAGAPFTFPGCTTSVPKYSFAATSTVGKRVAKSAALENLRYQFLLSKVPELTAWFATNTSLECTNTWTLPTGLVFNAPMFDLPGFDLRVTFHGVHLDAVVVATIRRNLSIKKLRTIGTMTDLYDFCYEDSSPFDIVRQAATVEIGWQASPGNVSGGVYWNQVEIDSTYYLHPRLAPP